MTGARGAAASWWAWFAVGRPHFLLGTPLFFALGIALASHDGTAWALPDTWWGLAAVLLLHWHVMYANAAWDIEADRHNAHRTLWAGGSRILVDQRLHPGVAHTTARVLLAAAVAVGAAWIIGRGWGTLAVAAVALVGAWGYSAPPLRLQARGLGPVTLAVAVAACVPAFAYFGQGGGQAWRLVVVVPLVLQTAALAAALDLPDVEGDALAGKRTWAVRRGRRRTARVAALLVLLSLATVPVAATAVPAGWTALAAAPFSLWAAGLLWRRGPDAAAWPRIQSLLIASIAVATAATLARTVVG